MPVFRVAPLRFALVPSSVLLRAASVVFVAAAAVPPALAEPSLTLAHERGQAPSWTLQELQGLYAEIGAAGRTPDVATQDAALAAVAGRVYGQSSVPGESIDRYARRILRARAPSHPKVAQGQGLIALMRQLYQDLADRATALARFSRDRRARAWLEGRAQEALAAAATLERELTIEVEGFEGPTALPPRVGGDPPARRGALAEVLHGQIIVERLPRVRFEADRPPEDLPRTRSGALQEVYAAFKQHATTAGMLGQYDPKWRRHRGHVQALLPAAAPAIYLNEIARAARAAGAHTLHLLTLDGRSELSEIPLALAPAGLKKGRRKTSEVPVACPDLEAMHDCARRLVHARTRGVPLLQVGEEAQ